MHPLFRTRYCRYRYSDEAGGFDLTIDTSSSLIDSKWGCAVDRPLTSKCDSGFSFQNMDRVVRFPSGPTTLFANKVVGSGHEPAAFWTFKMSGNRCVENSCLLPISILIFEHAVLGHVVSFRIPQRAIRTCCGIAKAVSVVTLVAWAVLLRKSSRHQVWT